MRILILDIVLYILQLTSLTVSFVDRLPHTVPKSEAFPYDDLLLPTHPIVSVAVDETDLESQHAKRRNVYEELDTDDPDLWPEQLTRGTSLSSSRDPPLIFSLSAAHMINLFFRLPSPTSAPGVLAGATPVPSPPATPIAEAVAAEDEDDDYTVRGTSMSTARAERDSADVGRIPGEYWIGRGDGG